MKDLPVFLRDNHVCVTGGTKGIGAAFVREYLRRGARKVSVIARHCGPQERQPLQHIAELQCREDSSNKTDTSNKTVKLKFEEADVSDPVQLANAMKSLTEDGRDPIMVLVCCAGFAHSSLIEDESFERYKQMISVNLLGSFFCIKEVLPQMKRSNYGAILLVGSEASFVSIYGFGAYSSTKFGLHALAETLTMETEGYNIKICEIFPCAVDTPGFEKENKDKLHITKLMEEIGGLALPEDVAKISITEFEKGSTKVTMGWSGWALRILNGGTDAATSCWQLIMEIALYPILRIFMVVQQWRWRQLIRTESLLPDDSMKKAKQL